MLRGKPFVISAPSGAGKSSLIEALLRYFPNQLRYSVSATTRSPRFGEVDSMHYYFKTPEQFKSMIVENELAEHNEVHGNFYGTPRGPLDVLLSLGMSVVLDLDVYGKVNFDKTYPEAIGILIAPPSFTELENRLRSRGTDSPSTIALRLKNARAELDFANEHGKYQYMIINDNFDQALSELIDVFKQELSPINP